MNQTIDRENQAARVRRRVLVAEDDADLRLALATVLGDVYEVVLEDSVGSALAIYPVATPDLLVVDYALPDATGVDLLEAIRKSWGVPAPAIMISAHSESRQLSRGAGFAAFVEKPLRTLDLVWAIERALLRSVWARYATQPGPA
jgi:CheY-like chemotaxis protein